MALLISDPATMGLSISDFTTIALGLTPNARCSAAQAGAARRAAGGGRRAAGGRDTTIAP